MLTMPAWSLLQFCIEFRNNFAAALHEQASMCVASFIPDSCAWWGEQTSEKTLEAIKIGLFDWLSPDRHNILPFCMDHIRCETMSDKARVCAALTLLKQLEYLTFLYREYGLLIRGFILQLDWPVRVMATRCRQQRGSSPSCGMVRHADQEEASAPLPPKASDLGVLSKAAASLCALRVLSASSPGSCHPSVAGTRGAADLIKASHGILTGYQRAGPWDLRRKGMGRRQNGACHLAYLGQ